MRLGTCRYSNARCATDSSLFISALGLTITNTRALELSDNIGISLLALQPKVWLNLGKFHAYLGILYHPFNTHTVTHVAVPSLTLTYAFAVELTAIKFSRKKTLPSLGIACSCYYVGPQDHFEFQ